MLIETSTSSTRTENNIKQLTEINSAVMAFYSLLKDDHYFRQFTHTHPKDMLFDENWKVFGLKQGPNLVAWGQIQFFSNPRKKHVARIGLAVSPVYRGEGYGSQMLDFILGYAEGVKGISKLTATTYNDLMLDMFKKRGFLIEGLFRKEEIINGVEVNIYSLGKLCF